MKARVLDFETTGMPEDKERGMRVGICEIGFTDVDLETREVGETIAAFVNPNMPIHPEAMAVHHITDADVAGAMNYMQACQRLMAGMEPGDVFVAHNAPFEQAFFGGGNYPWICTYRVAQHLWDNAPSYSNQVLRYWLSLDLVMPDPARAMPPHRAGPDTYVTAHILVRELQGRSVEELVKLTKQMPLLKTVPFNGEHKGKLFSELDERMLDWILKKDFKPEVMETARHWLRVKRQERNGIF